MRQSDTGKRMIVDVQTHLGTPIGAEEMLKKGFLEISDQSVVIQYGAWRAGGSEIAMDLERQMEVSIEAGITHRLLGHAMVLTLANEMLGLRTIEVAKEHNDYHAEVKGKFPNMIFPYGAVRPHDGKEAVKEVERCIDELGFKGLIVESSHGISARQYNHKVETYDFWECVNEKEIPVYFHPPALSYGMEYQDRYRFSESVARPNDTALNAALLIMSGLFDRFPKLKIVLPHMGGSFLMVLPRLQIRHRLGYEGLHEYQKPEIENTPYDYAKKHFWVDCFGLDPAGTKHAIEFFGVDHVLLGTDYGALPMDPKLHIDMVCNDLGLDEEDQNRILGLNAKELWALPDPE